MTDRELFLIDEGDKTYCFILWKLYNQIVSGDSKNPYTGKELPVERIYNEYRNQGPWEKLRHEQPTFRTQGLTPEQVIGLKLMQFGLVARPWNYGKFEDKPILIIGTIPMVPKHQEGMFAARLGINSDIIVSPREIDTVVNLIDYKGMMTVCNIWGISEWAHGYYCWLVI